MNKKSLELILENLLNLSAEKINEGVKNLEVNNYCKKHGHKPQKEYEFISSGSRHGPKIHGFCRRCYFPYERNLTPKELDNYTKQIQTHFTI